MSGDKFDIHQEITNSIREMIEAGAGDCMLPWHRQGDNLSMPVNISSEKPYQGVNVLQLWAMAMERGYEAPIWGTYKQWEEKGAQVRKGEKSTPVVFYKELSKENEAGEEEKIMFARAFRVFNAAQVDGYEPVKVERPNLVERLEHAEQFVANTGADIRHGGNRAFFRPSTDHIQMPNREAFTGTETSTPTEGYYSTLLHELGHWTGVEKRLNRDMGGKFGDPKYAAEEIIVELASSFLCAELGITPQPRQDHAAYIANWLGAMKEDKKFIFQAASHASKAANYLNSLQEKAVVAEVKEPAPVEQPVQEPENKWQNLVATRRDQGTQLGLF